MPNEEKKHPGGRPPKYRKDYVIQAAKLCRLGAIDKDLADFFGVNVATIQRWKIKYPEFRDSINKDKAYSNGKVKEALFKRACGYSHEEDKIFNDSGVPLVVPTIKHYPPDTAAAFIWLKNRDPDNWRDKQEVQHSIDSESYDKLKELYGHK